MELESKSRRSSATSFWNADTSMEPGKDKSSNSTSALSSMELNNEWKEKHHSNGAEPNSLCVPDS
jgi:hypothetical protein